VSGLARVKIRFVLGGCSRQIAAQANRVNRAIRVFAVMKLIFHCRNTTPAVQIRTTDFKAKLGPMELLLTYVIHNCLGHDRAGRISCAEEHDIEVRHAWGPHEQQVGPQHFADFKA
jgi:hypothetical protein